MTKRYESLALQGWGVRLSPMERYHAPELLSAASDGNLWSLPYTSVPGPDLASVRGYIDKALADRAGKSAVPFVVSTEEGGVVGSTRLDDLDRSIPNATIGFTWYGSTYQRTHVNTASKLLLLRHAFEDLGMKAVFFQTSHLNVRSQAAIETLGAHLDGVIRRHKRHKDGSLRDTFLYSILSDEWPNVERRLLQRLSR